MPVKSIRGIVNKIGLDRAVKFAQVKKETVIHAYPKSAASIQYKRLAADLIGENYSERVDLENNGIIHGILKYLGIRD